MRAGRKARRRAGRKCCQGRVAHEEHVKILGEIVETRAGFLKAQSNFILACSKKLAGRVQPFDQMKPRFHFTRADGDGLPRNF